MILTDAEILAQMTQGHIVITPFQRSSLGSNSYDVHLGAELAVYDHDVLDAKMRHDVKRFTIPAEGLIMVPQQLYLGVTMEYTETHMHVPFLEGKSSVGRLGIDIHATAGKGDIGFCNRWTLEISVKKPVRIYAGMPIGQLIYFCAHGQVLVPYKDKPSAKYNALSSAPVESLMYKNFGAGFGADKEADADKVDATPPLDTHGESHKQQRVQVPQSTVTTTVTTVERIEEGTAKDPRSSML